MAPSSQNNAAFHSSPKSSPIARVWAKLNQWAGHSFNQHVVLPLVVVAVAAIVGVGWSMLGHRVPSHAGAWTNSATNQRADEVAFLYINEDGHSGVLVTGGLGYRLTPDASGDWTSGRMECMTTRRDAGVFQFTPALSSAQSPNAMRLECTASGIQDTMAFHRPQ